MKAFAAGLTLVNVTTVVGLLLGMLGGGLDAGFAGLALIAGCAAAIVAWIYTEPFARRALVKVAPGAGEPKSKRARRRLKLPPLPVEHREKKNYHIWAWIVGALFALFALRSFCFLLYVDGANLKIQSPYNLGDLGLHLTYIKYFANGAALWPDNPIYVFSKLRYPAGTDLFNAILLLAHVNLITGLVWAGLLASAATFYGFYRWGGAFAVAAFLCNGGLAGYQFFQNWNFADYQSEGIAWKSIPLTMFVTQRGLLYAIPAGLLLLLHWRRKFFPQEPNESIQSVIPSGAGGAVEGSRGAAGKLIPWWVEWSLYASMPLFHVHTFLALSALLGCWLVIGSWEMRKQVAVLLAAAFLPATWLVWLITDHFGAKSILAWAPGWLESDPAFSTSILKFWTINFGLWLPAALVLVGLIGWRVWRKYRAGNWSLGSSLAFVLPAAAIFLFAIFVKTAPWGWDNTKLIIWAYFIILPFLWREVLAPLFLPVRYGVCFLLFASGFICLIGGLKVGSPGFDITNRLQLNAVGAAVSKVPIAERFAGFPTFNHLLLLNGRKMVLGYPGHLWTQGFDYAPVEQQLRLLMLGAPGWRERARTLEARYLFWGVEEQRAYAASTQPWRGQAAILASGPWGIIYDLRTPVASGVR
ncbi:MAG: hypothetical protein ABI233_06075 [Chthoniobacterales bacterium]